MYENSLQGFLSILFHEVKIRWKLFSASNSSGNLVYVFLWYVKPTLRCPGIGGTDEKGSFAILLFIMGTPWHEHFLLNLIIVAKPKYVPTFFPSCLRLCRLNKKFYFKSDFQYLVKLSLVFYKKRVQKNEIAISYK